ncbi:MAG: aminotransferase class IV [Planctomycetota bacterium]|nr:aminotransferase class IV [Planctomycetota bacterium]
MSSSTHDKSAGLELHALTSTGLRALALEGRSGTVHDLLEQLPVGVYSALRTFHHDRFLWLDEHLERTARSMASLGWTKTLERDALRHALNTVVRAYSQADARLRFDILREPATIQDVTAGVFIALSPFVAVPEEFMREGVRVELATHLHREAPLVKTTDFVRKRKPLPLSTRAHYEGVLLDSEQRILECSSANIAFVRGKTVIAAGDGVLEGITLKVVRHIAPTVGLAWVHDRLPLTQLATVDEAFLSSSSRGLVPITQIAEHKIGDGRVGANTRALLAAYLAFAEREAQRAVVQ